MKALDFEYDSLRLSDKGFMLCKFDSGGVDTISNGSEITLNTVPTMRGMKHELTSAGYEDCFTFTLQICKNLCNDSNMEISIEDARDIMRWLNRKNFHKFKLIDDEYIGIYFMVSFNVSRIEIDGKLVGFELEAVTNRPFALHDPVIINLNVASSDLTDSYVKPDGTKLDNVCIKSIYSKSDEEGYIYPDMEITIKEAGTLTIYNSFEDRTMTIKGCQVDEVITINYPMISSSLASHKIQNDFEWRFFRIASSFKNRLNEITISLPCSIKMTYSPVVKVGV